MSGLIAAPESGDCALLVGAEFDGHGSVLPLSLALGFVSRWLLDWLLDGLLRRRPTAPAELVALVQHDDNHGGPVAVVAEGAHSEKPVASISM